MPALAFFGVTNWTVALVAAEVGVAQLLSMLPPAFDGSAIGRGSSCVGVAKLTSALVSVNVALEVGGVAKLAITLELEVLAFEPAHADVVEGYEASVEMAFNGVELVDLGVLVLALPVVEALLGEVLFEVAAPGLEEVAPKSVFFNTQL